MTNSTKKKVESKLVELRKKLAEVKREAAGVYGSMEIRYHEGLIDGAEEILNLIDPR